MKTIPPHSKLTEAQLDSALASGSDSILPSSGFTESVMAAVYAQSAAPAPIPFPWKRALPGFAAAVAALALLSAALFAMLRVHLAVAPEPQDGRAALAALLQQAATGHTVGLAVAFAITLASLLLCRHLVSPH